MDLLSFSIFCLTVFRVSHMLVNENGPGDICKKLRAWAGVDDKLDSQDDQKGYFAKLLFCLACVSVMVALPFWWFCYLAPKLFILLFGFLGASTVVMFLEKIYR